MIPSPRVDSPDCSEERPELPPRDAGGGHEEGGRGEVCRVCVCVCVCVCVSIRSREAEGFSSAAPDGYLRAGGRAGCAE